jgi:hypothetical protein
MAQSNSELHNFDIMVKYKHVKNFLFSWDIHSNSMVSCFHLDLLFSSILYCFPLILLFWDLFEFSVFVCHKYI